MVEVEVRQEEMDATRAAFDEVCAERADTGSRVEDQRDLVVERDLDA
jgi:hypothetical protein